MHREQDTARYPQAPRCISANHAHALPENSCDNQEFFRAVADRRSTLDQCAGHFRKRVEPSNRQPRWARIVRLRTATRRGVPKLIDSALLRGVSRVVTGERKAELMESHFAAAEFWAEVPIPAQRPSLSH